MMEVGAKKQDDNTYLDILDNLTSKKAYLHWFSCFQTNCCHQIRDISTFLKAPGPSINTNNNNAALFAGEMKITWQSFHSKHHEPPCDIIKECAKIVPNYPKNSP